ncbi:MAG: deoxyguanosinetriphosphate triphosphohydrolase [Tissierellia bacterium]|nr:deoxyguanosinetriphosphate triphosphohydrolase [Tissierellia bacterium]
MIARIQLEEREAAMLSPRAALSRHATRDYPEEPDELRTLFQQDRDRILHCKAFRRLKHKTQVFLSPEGDHYRTRLTHTLEVSQIARTLARALALNEDLTEAMALAHDLGHTPFGHCGEEALNELHPGGFVHAEQSLRVVEVLEQRRNKPFPGLNLTQEVREGIAQHTGSGRSKTLEGQILKYADRIAYINHDIDDAIRAGILTEEDLPLTARSILGGSPSERIHTMVVDLVSYSRDKEEISMSPPVEEAMLTLRSYLFENLYRDPQAKSEEKHAKKLIAMLYTHFRDHPDDLPHEYARAYTEQGVEAVKDYIAGMSDHYAIRCFSRLFIPEFWR